jgi:hypothetical protein
LYDLGRKKKYAGTNGVRRGAGADMDDGEYGRARRMVGKGLGFDYRAIPAGAAWIRGPEGTGEGGDLYELAWTGQERAGKTFSRKWTVTVDPVTKRPREVQQFEKWSADSEWIAQWKTEFEYLTDEEMAAVMGEQTADSGTY